MGQPDDAAALHDHYALGRERDRLDAAVGVVEFERTREILLRHLPAPPSVVADIGGGPGRYALWLAGRGHRVEYRDLVALHVEQLRAAAGDAGRVGTAVGDARRLDLGDASVDAVLLLGPIYQLRDRADRLRALGEARRVVRPGGRCSWPPSHGGRRDWAASWPHASTSRCRRSGRRRRGWSAPDGCRRCSPGRPPATATGRAVVLDAARAIERVPELLGLGPHLPATARRPPG